MLCISLLLVRKLGHVIVGDEAVEDRNVSLDECHAQIREQGDLFGIIAVLQAQIRRLRERVERLGEVLHELRRARRKREITEGNDRDKLGLAVKVFVN